MLTRSQTNETPAAADGDASNSDSDADATAVNIGAQDAMAQPQANVGGDALATLVASIASLRASVEELRNETSRSQAEVQQLRLRMEMDSANATAPTCEVQPPVQQFPQAVQQLPVVQPPLPLPTNALQFVEGSAAKLYPLPTFDGSPEDWPLFSANYVDTTAEFGYNNRQNLMRLQKALQGNAKRAVMSMLIYPDDVPKVMKELEFNFGRHDLLIRAQLQKVQQFPTIHDNRLDQVLEFSNRVRNIAAFFKSAQCEHHLMNPTLLEQLISKLPPSKQYEWSKHAANIKPFPTVDKFADWLSDLAKVVSIMPGVAEISLRYSQASLPSSRQQSGSSRQFASSGVPARRVLHSSCEQPVCLCCNQSHVLTDCRKFKSNDCPAKWLLVKQHRLCFGCLQAGHGLSDCRRRKACAINGCKRMHHQLLHQDNQPSSQPTADRERILNCRQESEVSLFKILPVILSGPHGSVNVYAMFDEGSSVSLLEEEVATRLGLRGRVKPLTLQWYGDSQTTENSRPVSCDVRGVNGNNYSLKDVHTIKSLNLPRQSLDKFKYVHLKELPVRNYVDVKPVLLLGLDNCHLSVPIKTVAARYDQPVAINTRLGWVVYGPHRQESVAVPRVLHVRKSDALKQLNKLEEDYFATENFGVNSQVVLESDENQRARKILAETTRDLGQGYEVGLLWREDSVILPPSYAMAKHRLLNIESRMQRDAVFAENYKREVAKYLDKGYAKPLTPDEASVEGPRTWYLPHFGVVNPHKPQKLRIVFDAAAATNGISLNSVLLKGPEQAQPLIAIIHKFRQGVVAVAGDIQEMFSRVQILEADQESQRFLWRDGNTSEPIRIYKMSSMIFGAICSPCCAEHVKNTNAIKFMSTMPRGARAVIENTYVDDLVMSFNSAEEAIEVINEAVKINAAASFKLRDFISNDKLVQQKLNGEGSSANKQIIRMERQATMEKVLGMFWNTANDGLEFQFKFHKITHDVIDGTRPPTKRELLGIAMSMYDPFGLLANVTICIKLLVQAMWKQRVQWDEAMPYELAQQWSKWWSNIQSVKHLSVPRCYSLMLPVAEEIQLHIFVDASSLAYAAVAYLRIKKGDKIDVAMVCAKSRCSPLKGMTIPRLELQAAVLGCRLKESLERCHDFRVSSTTFWSDSKTVILWIRSTHRDYKQFVAYRVAEILSTTSSDQWRWIPTSLNVADEATRAYTSFECNIKSRWFTGPGFLYEDATCWPQEIPELTSDHRDLEEATKRIIMLSSPGEYPIKFTNFSKFLKVTRVVAWVLRFFNNAKSEVRRSGELNSAELAKAEMKILRQVQFESFSDEIHAIKQKKCLPKSSFLYQLTPFIDDDGLLKVNGRIDAAYCLPIAARRPVILPQTHYVTRLIVKQYHCRLHHQNESLTINEMRQKFWVPRARALLKSVKRNCNVCIYNSAKPAIPLMGQLPTDRLTPHVRPFSYAGVDYCGPFYVTIGRRKEKRWVSLFTCLTTRAAHLEIAEDLSTDAFILCLRNFVNRRGVPIRIRSDNGTNFVGAQKELKAEERMFDFGRIEGEMARRNIEWVFNCPANPSAGGCWERLVQCVKRLLQRVLQQESPRLETFRSVLIEAENIINSRPLTELAVSPQDEEPLTPNHFLLGCLNSTQTPSPVDEK
ncbi:uncharacterized protein LOC118756307, partial [Rhagoletis pomonella]|uniref:uncharacterized protein LOC118756307 n=1 Tax=Rhagoletis pomonella TaxID=28610 RepID=UPI001783B373